MTTICTGFNPKGYEDYGANFLESFDQYWPKAVRLQCYVETAPNGFVPRGGERSLWTCRGAKEFIERNSSNLQRCGRAPTPGWRPKDHSRGYSFKWDAVKFSRQCFIPEAASDELEDGEVLAWFDADVVTFRPVPGEFVERTLGGYDLCYLGRLNMHSEIGFWAVRLSQKTRAFLASLAALYRDDVIFTLREWHSAFAFDYVRSKAEYLSVYTLTPRGMGHVWFQSPLAQYTDHLKGERRKLMGKSPERKIG